jgi:hypothetical protein
MITRVDHGILHEGIEKELNNPCTGYRLNQFSLLHYYFLLITIIFEE